MNNIDKESFECWWHEEGSGMLRYNDEDVAEWVQRMAETAWMNGAYAARGQWPTATIPTPGDDDRFFHAWLCELAKGEWGVTKAELREWFAETVEGAHDNYGSPSTHRPTLTGYDGIEKEWKAKLKAKECELEACRSNGETAIKRALGQCSDAQVSIGEHGEVFRHGGRTEQIQ